MAVSLAGCAAKQDGSHVPQGTDRVLRSDTPANQGADSVQLRKPWLNPASGPTPPEAAAAAAFVRKDGERYDAVLDDAWNGDSLALGWMFGYEDQGAFSGVAAKEHHRVLLALLDRVGDSVYASCLKREGLRTHRKVARALLETAGANAGTLRHTNPRTFDIDSIGARD